MNMCPLLCLLRWLRLEKVSHTFMCMFMGKLLNILRLQQHASVEQEKKIGGLKVKQIPMIREKMNITPQCIFYT